MEIQILSRKNMSKLFRENNHNVPLNTNIISIRDVGQSRLHRDCPEILNLAFNDMLKGDKNFMTNKQATLVKNFATKTFHEGKNLIIHCNGGVSRSAGCAAAISKGLSETLRASVSPASDEIWSDMRFVPNESVFQLVLAAFDIIVTDEEIDQMVKRHADQWFKQRIR